MFETNKTWTVFISVIISSRRWFTASAIHLGGQLTPHAVISSRWIFKFRLQNDLYPVINLNIEILFLTLCAVIIHVRTSNVLIFFENSILCFSIHIANYRLFLPFKTDDLCQVRLIVCNNLHNSVHLFRKKKFLKFFGKFFKKIIFGLTRSAGEVISGSCGRTKAEIKLAKSTSECKNQTQSRNGRKHAQSLNNKKWRNKRTKIELSFIWPFGEGIKVSKKKNTVFSLAGNYRR